MAQPGPSPNTDATNADGSVDFSGGVDSLKVTTVQSQQNPNGLGRNELAWLINGTVRDGGITPRGGWSLNNRIGSGSLGYQGGYLYQPIDGSDPYFIFLIGGRVLKCLLDGSPPEDLFTTSYVISPSDKPSITIRNINLTPGATIPVADDIQSFFGLPATFVAPAEGANKTFFTAGNIQGSVGQTILFYGAFQITVSSFTFDSTSLVWTANLTLQNQSYPVGVQVSAAPFGNPHGIPINGGISNYLTGWTYTPFNAPAIGATVNVAMTRQAAQKMGNAHLFFTNGSGILEYKVQAVFIPGHGNQPAETITYDSGTATLVDTLNGIMLLSDPTFPNGWCNKPMNLTVGTPIPQGPAIQFDCSNFPGWTFDAFNANSGATTLVARQPNPVPSDGLTVGSILNFQFGVAVVTNVNNTTFGQFGSPGVKPFFEQANDFLIIQAGDYTSLPLFWDGTVLRKSLGINDSAVAPGTPGVNEIPPAGPMRFYLGRLFYSTGNKANAGDITGGNSGTAQYEFRDAVLNVTESPLVLGGDGFRTPANEGNITAIAYNANQDTALGQGTLFLFTAKGVHALTVPITRTDWIAATSNNQPKLVPIQLAMGTVSDRSVVTVNGDLFYQDPLGNIRTLLTAVRYFGQWGNIPISSNINRLIQFNNKSLLNWGCGIYFDNRMIQTALPIGSNQGTVHQAVSVMDLEEISSFGSSLTPTWEGMYEGLDILQMFSGVVSGVERAFAVIVSRVDFSIQIWELTPEDRFDNGDRRIQMVIEFPAFTWGQEFSLKELMGAELWIDRLYGEVVFKLEYRPDGESCWVPWHDWKVCAPRNSCENTGVDPCTGIANVLCYPLTQYGESYRQTLTLPHPPRSCSSAAGRPSFVNYQAQPRLIVTGFCRIRGFLLHAASVERGLYQNKVC